MIERVRSSVDRFDVLIAVGLVLLSAGLVWVWWPLALIVPGAVLLALGVLGAIVSGLAGHGEG